MCTRFYIISIGLNRKFSRLSEYNFTSRNQPGGIEALAASFLNPRFDRWIFKLSMKSKLHGSLGILRGFARHCDRRLFECERRFYTCVRRRLFETLFV
jgi:hypothetical protein